MRDSSLRLPAVMLTTQQAEIKAPAAAARISIKVQAAVAVILPAQNPVEVLPLLKDTTPSSVTGPGTGLQLL